MNILKLHVIQTRAFYIPNGDTLPKTLLLRTEPVSAYISKKTSETRMQYIVIWLQLKRIQLAKFYAPTGVFIRCVYTAGSWGMQLQGFPLYTTIRYSRHSNKVAGVSSTIQCHVHALSVVARYVHPLLHIPGASRAANAVIRQRTTWLHQPPFSSLLKLISPFIHSSPCQSLRSLKL